MDAKIWVSNLDVHTSAEQLEALFAEYGEVTEIIISEDPEAGKKTYNALVTMADQEDAAMALEELEGQRLNRLTLQLDWFEEFDDEDQEDDDLDYDDDGWGDEPSRNEPESYHRRRYAQEWDD